MITSFACSETAKIFAGKFSKRFHADIQKIGRRKLLAIHYAKTLNDLSLPGLHLEMLKGDRKGQYSVRINKQFRVCFKWIDGNAEQVEIVDYH